MSATVPDDWDDVVETLRRDLEAVGDDESDEDEASSAIDEVWAIVDEYEDRVGRVDVERIGDVLGVDPEAVDGQIDASSIPRSLVVDDPRRAAGLSRMVSLIALDDATDYDVGRLWVENGDDEGDVDDGSVGGESADEGGSGSGSADRSSEADAPDGPQSGPGTDESSDASGGGESAETEGDESAEAAESGEASEATESGEGSESEENDDVTEEVRSKLGDSLSGLRDRIQAARDEAEEATESEDGDGEDAGDEETSRSRSSGSSNRGSTGISTLPADRHDMDGVPRFSTMPDRSGR